MRAKVIACRTMADEILKVLPADLDLELLPYALHNTPKKLHYELQERIDTDTLHDTLLFGYGLCSSGLANLHTVRHTLVVPKTHDCISLLFGARELYDQEFAVCPATFFLSKGWIDQGAEPYAAYKRYREKYGEDNASWIIHSEYCNYQRVTYIHSGVDAGRNYVDYARTVADFLKVEFVEREGSLRLLDKLFQGQWDSEFVVTPPGQILLQHHFL